MSIDGVKQFAITRYDDRAAVGYVITHIESGYGVSATFDCVDNAVTVAMALDIFNWAAVPPSDTLKERAREVLYGFTDRGIGSLWPAVTP